MDPPQLRISPPQVLFPTPPHAGPPSPPPTATITIGTAPGGAAPPVPVAFKIKTTRPARYVVRPNAGVLPPGLAASVEISLTPGAPVPPPSTLARDKFLVQAGAVPPGGARLDDAFWDGPGISRTKLTVAVDGAGMPGDAAGGVGGASAPPSPGYNIPSRPPSYASASSGLRPDSGGPASGSPTAPRRAGAPATSVAAHVAQLQAGALPPTPPGAPVAGRIIRVGAPAPAMLPGTAIPGGATVPAPALTAVADKDGLPAAGVAGARPGDAALATEYGALLAPGRHDEAVERAREVGRALEASRAEVARVRTAVEETKAAAETILEEAPKAPLATHPLASDAYGGVSVAGVGLMVAVAAVLTKLVW